MRELGVPLPIEIWYKPEELNASHPLLCALEDQSGIVVRAITDPRATRFYTKLYAVYYSVFDHVLLLDADSYAVRNPTYLFGTEKFQTTGAMFWPDYWRPSHNIFHVHDESLLWQVLGITYVDMFEQESGQVLIDRRRHEKALNVLMLYGFALPRVHEDLDFVYGDKDLFRFAWMKTNSSFHFIERPPGSAGLLDTTDHRFCGVAMVQHDPRGEIVFYHRNMEKLSLERPNKRLMTHVQQFRHGEPLSKYRPDGSGGFIGVSDTCWGKDAEYEAYTITPVEEFEFVDRENRLLQFVEEAKRIVQTAMHASMN